MPDYKIILGAIASILGVAGYLPYLLDMYRGKTKPHAFTWLIFAVLAGISFFAQLTESGGAGVWLTAITGSVSAIIFVVALFRGVRTYVPFDWLCLAGAAIAIAIWALSGEAFLAVILIVIIDVFGMLPLLRHCYLKPNEETASMFAIYFFAWIFSILALETYNATTVLYASYSVVMNAIVVATLLWRRKAFPVK